MPSYFISGIDTGIGKTIATGLLARAIRHLGKSVITMKMVQTGNTGFSEDLEKHREIMEVPPFPEDRAFLTAPEIFSFPASPLLASKIDKRPLNPKKIRAAADELAKHYEYVLIEGAGGLAVPLTEDLLTIDFAAENHYPLLLLTSGRLGSLNHTFLSLEAALRRGMKIAGILYREDPTADPLIEKDSLEMIPAYLKKNGVSAPLIRIPDWKPDCKDPDVSGLL